MKSTLKIFGILFAFAFMFSSCKKCVDCDDCQGVTGDETEICESDYDSKKQYDAAVALVETFGNCECK